LAARQRGIGLGLPRREDRIMRRILDRTPVAPRLFREIAGLGGECAEHGLLRLHARSRRQYETPELVLPLIDPEQIVLHRLAIVGRPQLRRAPELAVPGV